MGQDYPFSNIESREYEKESCIYFPVSSEKKYHLLITYFASQNITGGQKSLCDIRTQKFESKAGTNFVKKNWRNLPLIKGIFISWLFLAVFSYFPPFFVLPFKDLYY